MLIFCLFLFYSNYYFTCIKILNIKNNFLLSQYILKRLTSLCALYSFLVYFFYQGCFAHLLNLIVQKFYVSIKKTSIDEVNEEDFSSDDDIFNEKDNESDYTELEDVHEISTTEVDCSVVLKKVKAIVNQFSKSVELSSKLKEAQKNEKNAYFLLNDVKTRWNSTYLMIERFLKVYKFVKEVLSDRRYAESHKNFLNEEELAALETICGLLKPFYKSTVNFT